VVDPPSEPVEGKASESGPGGLNESWKTWMNALTVPTCGSCRSMIRQITPAANSEIAIGMKTAVLNATDHAILSVRTAKMRPIAVMSAGTTATQIKLFLIATTKGFERLKGEKSAL
jgi:hypothetical protein